MKTEVWLSSISTTYSSSETVNELTPAVISGIDDVVVLGKIKQLERSGEWDLIVVDAEEGITDQDLTIAGYAHERGRAIIIVVNKWDLLKKDNKTMSEYIKDVRAAFRFLPDLPERIHFLNHLPIHRGSLCGSSRGDLLQCGS